VVAGVKPGRKNEDELIIDMNIGMGVEDVVVGAEIFKRASEQGLGRVLPL
jgi:ornithine cyclodeaminase/alanine dehydrogenase-like protein (mu-crystallin family)